MENEAYFLTFFLSGTLWKREKTSFPVVCLTSIKPSVLSRAVKIITASEHCMTVCVCADSIPAVIWWQKDLQRAERERVEERGRERGCEGNCTGR